MVTTLKTIRTTNKLLASDCWSGVATSVTPQVSWYLDSGSKEVKKVQPSKQCPPTSETTIVGLISEEVNPEAFKTIAAYLQFLACGPIISLKTLQVKNLST